MEYWKKGLKEIAATDYYELFVNIPKNRVYCSKYGFWNALPMVSDYISDWEDTMNYVSEGFTVLVDETQLRVRSEKWVEMTIGVQKVLKNRGMSRMSEISSTSDVLKMQSERISKMSDIFTKRKEFTNQEDAEAWLDSYVRSENVDIIEELRKQPPLSFANGIKLIL